MKLKLLPSTFESDGTPSLRQHFTSFVINDRIALDAGSLGFAASDAERDAIRDVILSHAHLDHVAGLAVFIDDLFATLTEPVRIYAEESVVDVLENHIFNWKVYPRFSELRNSHGEILTYRTFRAGEEFNVGDLSVLPVPVDHIVPSCGFILSDGTARVAITGDTAHTESFWRHVDQLDRLDAILIECAFPNELANIAAASAHLTPAGLAEELRQLTRSDCEIYVTNLKPSHRESTKRQLMALGDDRLRLLEVGREYRW